jgi:tetratricopeptide (TPR) repeat protein
MSMAAACGRDAERLLTIGWGATETRSQQPVAAAGQTPDGPPRTDRDVAPPPPRQLPAAHRQFTARATEISTLARLLDEHETGSGSGGGPLITVIDGTAGIGKTTLAVHWAHQVAGRFPDGQLYADLRGFAPDRQGLAPTDVLHGFLTALGVPPARQPTDPVALAAAYRSRVADLRMLILLDNARDSAHVRTLLPGGSGCAVLVTSRGRLLDLVAMEGARSVSLALPSPDDALALLARQTGTDRIDADPEAAAALVDACARLPLAISVAGARAAARPALPLAVFVEELLHTSSRLDTLTVAGADIRAVFSWSYAQLRPAAARLFRLFGASVGPDSALSALASLAGLPEAETGDLLGELTQANLLTEVAPGRYACHDLLRIYAREQADQIEGPTQVGQARLRLLDHYLHSAYAAGWLLSAQLPRSELATPAEGVHVERFGDDAAALAWLAAEHQVLLAAVRTAFEYGYQTHAQQLPFGIANYLHRRGHWHDWLATQRVALAAACRQGDAASQARAHRGIGAALVRLGEFDDAERELRAALDLHRELGDDGEAPTRSVLGWLFDEKREYHKALPHARRARELYRVAGDRAGEAAALNAIGFYHAQLGEYERALGPCQQALSVLRERGDRGRQADVLDSLGLAYRKLGRFDESIDSYQQAVALFHETGDRYYYAQTLANLGDALLEAGRPGEAERAWEQALGTFDELRHPDGAAVRRKLNQLRGNPPNLDRTPADATS